MKATSAVYLTGTASVVQFGPCYIFESFFELQIWKLVFYPLLFFVVPILTHVKHLISISKLLKSVSRTSNLTFK